MSISKDNTRTQITIPKELKTKLEQLAKDDNRSFNNLVITVLKDYASTR
jgi:predicted HicB family RNase H-like nuclease